MKAKVQSLTRIQFRTGRVPRNSLKKYPELQRAFRVKNRMENGFDISLSDISYKEMVLIEYINSWINEAQNQLEKKRQQELR